MKAKTTRLISYGATACCFALAGYAIYYSSSPAISGLETHTSANQADSTWEPFSPERVAELRAQGRPVLVDFTAKWCLICQTNHIVMSQGEVDKKLEELGVVRMKADWTKNDEVITQELRKFGRNGVPLYLFYGASDQEQPEILPQVLTSEILLKQLDKLENAANTLH